MKYGVLPKEKKKGGVTIFHIHESGENENGWKINNQG